MKDEHNVGWLAPAFAVLKCSPSINSQRRVRKESLATKERTEKRHAKRKST